MTKGSNKYYLANVCMNISDNGKVNLTKGEQCGYSCLTNMSACYSDFECNNRFGADYICKLLTSEFSLIPYGGYCVHKLVDRVSDPDSYLYYASDINGTTGLITENQCAT